MNMLLHERCSLFIIWMNPGGGAGVLGMHGGVGEMKRNLDHVLKKLSYHSVVFEVGYLCL